MNTIIKSYRVNIPIIFLEICSITGNTKNLRSIIRGRKHHFICGNRESGLNSFCALRNGNLIQVATIIGIAIFIANFNRFYFFNSNYVCTICGSDGGERSVVGDNGAYGFFTSNGQAGDIRPVDCFISCISNIYVGIRRSSAGSIHIENTLAFCSKPNFQITAADDCKVSCEQ